MMVGYERLRRGRPVLFLDFDGVLAPTREGYRFGHFAPGPVTALNWLIYDADPDIVVSSTWRYHWPSAEGLAELLYLEGVVGAKVVGLTPTRKVGGAARGIVVVESRGEEIAWWLCERMVNDQARYGDAAGTPPFVILDDGRDMGLLSPALVWVEPARGLTLDEAREASHRLRRGQESAKVLDRPRSDPGAGRPAE